MLANNRGYLIADMLVGLLLVSFLAQGAMTVLSNNTRLHSQQSGIVAMEQNLRVAVGTIADELRGAGYGVPRTDVATWIPWVSGLTSNPKITGSSPATVTLARCTRALARFSGPKNAGDTQLSLQSDVPGANNMTDVLNNTTKRLILIGGEEYAHVTAVTGNSVQIDTDPTQTGNQGLSRQYSQDTSVCRVDVLTFAITTGKLTVDENQGQGPRAVAEGIDNLQITTLTTGQRYELTLTASTERADPFVGQVITRSLRSDVTVRNGLL